MKRLFSDWLLLSLAIMNFVVVNLLDWKISAALIREFGLAGESNPIAKHLFQHYPNMIPVYKMLIILCAVGLIMALWKNNKAVGLAILLVAYLIIALVVLLSVW